MTHRLDVGVVGAGVVGLSTAHYLRGHGCDVTVYDAGDADSRPASWGNAGHVLPVMSVPVTNAKNISDAVTSLVKKNSFVTVPRQISSEVVAFLTAFARNSTSRRWAQSLRAMAPLNAQAIQEYETLERAGIDVGFHRRDFVSAFGSMPAVGHQLYEIAMAASVGLEAEVSLLSREELAEREPLAAHVGRFGVVLKNQAMLNPLLLLRGLRAAVVAEGVLVREQSRVTAVASVGRDNVQLELAGGARETHEKVVIATGAWLDELMPRPRKRTRVLAGFGYSAFVEDGPLPEGMLYFPEAKIATTVMGKKVRVSTLLQIDTPDGPFRQESGARLLSTARAVLPNLRWETAQDLWHGGRPLSSTGRPVIGETAWKNVYVNGGHGMWGVTLGPVSGRLLADAIVAGRPQIDAPGFEAR